MNETENWIHSHSTWPLLFNTFIFREEIYGQLTIDYICEKYLISFHETEYEHILQYLKKQNSTHMEKYKSKPNQGYLAVLFGL